MFKSRKKLNFVFAGFTLAVFVYFFWCINFCVADSYTLMEGSSLKSHLPPGIFSFEDIPASVGGKLSGSVTAESTESKATLSIMGVIPAGQVSVKTLKVPTIYPSGECIGLKMYVDGLLVSGFCDFETPSGVCPSPGIQAGIKEGDIIDSINGIRTSSIREFSGACDSSEEYCILTINRGGKKHEIRVYPRECVDGHKRLGIYVKNSIAGVGTITYRTEKGFGALGHGITDSGVLVPMKSGKIYKTDIIDINPGKKGVPGEIVGAISESSLLGDCKSNTTEGIYGTINDDNGNLKPIEPASSENIQKGRASIICTVGTDDVTREYDIEIISVNHLRSNKTKSFSFRVTDENLIRETGGIVQGMSGSPIIQNGKLIGAVTHVFVNDPTRGYGIFIENMLAEAEKIK